jgi:hypothetical protein
MFGSYPYRALKGVQPKEVWKEVLYQNSARGNQDFHFFWVLCTLHLRNISRHWFTLLDYPPVCGWYALLVTKVVL